VLRRAPAARPAMEEEDRNPLWSAQLLVVDLVQLADLQISAVVGLDFGEQMILLRAAPPGKCEGTIPLRP
jgi:hypothetical protein